MHFSKEDVRRLLTELAEWFEIEGVDSVDWVVCGGVALSLQNLITRTTRDVDVLGNWNESITELVPIDRFPEAVVRCIDRVAQTRPQLASLHNRWVNLGPRDLCRRGLPQGFESRMKTVQFGNKLKLHLLGRDDLLALKLYAASDELGTRAEIHFRDVEALHPTEAELDKAVDWVRTMPNFEPQQPALKRIIEDLGYDGLAIYI